MLLHWQLVSVPGRKYSRSGCGIQGGEMAGMIYPHVRRADGRMFVLFSSQTDTYTGFVGKAKGNGIQDQDPGQNRKAGSVN